MHKQKIILELLLKVEARLLAMLKPIRRQRWWKGKFAFFWRLAIWGASQVVLLLKNLLDNAGDIRHRFDPWVGKIPWEGNGNPPQCSWLENPVDIGAWWATVHGLTKSQTQLSNWACTWLFLMLITTVQNYITIRAEVFPHIPLSLSSLHSLCFSKDYLEKIK